MNERCGLAVPCCSLDECTLEDEEDDAGDVENNGGMGGGPALFWVELYNLTSLHSTPPLCGPVPMFCLFK